MTDHIGCIRGYHRSSKANYKDVVESIQVMFGMYHPDGGTSGEMCMQWVQLDTLTPQLTVYNDAWSALSLFEDVINKIGELDDMDISEEQFVALLDTCGFKDLTAY